MVKKLSNTLLEKESLDIIQIIDVLGERPHPLPESVQKYIIEIKNKEAEKAAKKENEDKLNKELNVENSNKNDNNDIDNHSKDKQNNNDNNNSNYVNDNDNK